ncbi:Prolactin-5A1, partial [Cricetulus griseus]
ILLLLVVSIVQVENKNSRMNVKRLKVSYPSPFGKMLDQAIKLSQDMNLRISALSTHFNRFYASGRGFHNRIIKCHTSPLSRPENKEQAQNTEDAQYDPGQKFLNRPTMICHTASRSIPNSKRKAERMKSVDLLNVTIRILAAWKNLLYHVKNNMADLDGTPYATTVKVEFLDGQIKRLTKHLQGIKTILSQVHPELKENENYPAWSGEPYVQQSRRGIQLFGLHSLFFCLHSDAQKVSDFVSILRHQIVPNK